MSEHIFNGRDNLVQLENFIESSTYQDNQDTQNLISFNDTLRDDCWQYENLPGSQAEPQLHAHHDPQDYYPFTTETFTDSPPNLSSWPGVHPNGQSSFGDGDEPHYPDYFSAFSSGPRELGWTESRWPEQHLSTPSEQFVSHPPAELSEGYEIRPTDSSCSLGFPVHEDSRTPRFLEGGAFAEGEANLTGTTGSLSGGFNFAHMYEPAPSSTALPSLLAQWIDTSPQGFQASLDLRLSVHSQHSFMDHERPFALSQAAESVGQYDSSLGLYSSGFNESPIDVGSLPELSCSRRQTPGSGPMDVTSTERPMTPLGAGGRYERAGCKHNENHPSESSGSLCNPHSLSRNSTFYNSAETSSSRSSSIFAFGTSSESHSRPTEPNRTASLDSQRSVCNILSAISIPSPPQLFANTPISRGNRFGKPSALKFNGLLPPITDAHLQARNKETGQPTDVPQSAKDAKRSLPRSNTDRPKRKRMHVCGICGKDFNRPSALALHGTVHTGERSNFCNVCGRSFSNLSNLRRHQRQLHVLESQMRLPEIPGPTSELDAYNFGSQTRF
ncbi:hypothetical protein, variant [Puccinia triticina 1-1 BBBD Race 1]|uniref:C2H2-type domain-containing protein n=1 Tax=Puccinia triticina (isolate 1-1 / race 1 (BBBD)) TaxID=630390 RepID=A0A180GQW7_PUCT1|nr:hypothetical protein PTTG_12685 [Puccinia triticina 1-1 BBBD Race 1]OAV94672.1 hypothetical protein, variant [Puccinia triticina 1-1 BBBD Race 1]